MSDIPDMQELVREITREQLLHNGLSATHPMLYVSVSDAKRLLDMLREQQAEIEGLQAWGAMLQFELSGKVGELEQCRQAAIWLSTRVSAEELAWACDTWPWLGEEREAGKGDEREV